MSAGRAGLDAILIFVSTFLLMNIGTVDAHGYLMSPRSRNFLAHSSQDGKGQYGSTATDPKVDYEVRSLLLLAPSHLLDANLTWSIRCID